MDSIQQNHKDYYNQHAKKYSEREGDPRSEIDSFLMFLKHFRSINGTSIIDIGCGSGKYTPLFLEHNITYLGFDISEALLTVARERYPCAEFIEGNILDAATLPQGQFDGFWAVASLQHIPKASWPTMLQNFETVIKPGGIGHMSLPATRSTDAKDDSEKQKDTRYFDVFAEEEVAELVDSR